MTARSMLVRNAEIWRYGTGDVRIEEGRIAAVGTFEALDGECVVEGEGHLLIPGLHDHHIHLPALAARRASVFCGPPEVQDEAQLAERLAAPRQGWLRGIGYHESVAGMLDAAMLDRIAPDHPVRIQHRSGRMWFLNSRALDILMAAAEAPPGLDRQTGRLFDEDVWLRAALGSTPPDFAELSTDLSAWGITGLTDMTPQNDGAIAAHFTAQQKAGLRQRVLLAGTLQLNDVVPSEMLRIGPAKLHLHEAQLPDYDATVRFIGQAHEQARAVAIHCVSEVELVFALAALEEAGIRQGDRIEHASVAPDHLVERIAQNGLAVVSQPNFIAERGDQYLADVDADTVPYLYRLRAFQQAGVTLAAGSDAPFGCADPWAAMAAAVSRRTPSGAVIGREEALSPEASLALFLADPEDLRHERRIEPGAPADLVLLDRDWKCARADLAAVVPRLTMVAGSIVHQGVDHAPFQRRFGTDSLSGQDHQCCALTPDAA